MRESAKSADNMRTEAHHDMKRGIARARVVLEDALEAARHNVLQALHFQTGVSIEYFNAFLFSINPIMDQFFVELASARRADQDEWDAAQDEWDAAQKERDAAQKERDTAKEMWEMCASTFMPRREYQYGDDLAVDDFSRMFLAVYWTTKRLILHGSCSSDKAADDPAASRANCMGAVDDFAEMCHQMCRAVQETNAPPWLESSEGRLFTIDLRQPGSDGKL